MNSKKRKNNWNKSYLMYESMSEKRKPLVFNEDSVFSLGVIWVKHNKHQSSGYYYKHIYTERYERKAIII